MSSHRLQRGLSLIELMVAMTIGLFLLLGLVQIFSATRVSFGANEGLARVQENSRFAVQFMREDMRMAGNMGCLNELGLRGRMHNHLLVAPVPLTPAAATAAQWPYLFHYPVEVYEFNGSAPGDTLALGATRTTPAASSWTPALPASLAGTALDASDVIVVRYLSADYARITSIDYTPGAEKITVNAADSAFIVPGSIYGITDCKNLSLFQINAGGSIKRDAGTLNVGDWIAQENGYGEFNLLHRYRFVAYYVGTGANGEPGLFRRELADDGTLGAGQEVVPGVESLQVVLGANLNLRSRTEGDIPEKYLTAAEVNTGGAGWAGGSTVESRWASVVNFRLGMLIRSPQGAGMGTPTIAPRIADTTITTPADGRVRQAYETQIAIRNRIRG